MEVYKLTSQVNMAELDKVNVGKHCMYNVQPFVIGKDIYCKLEILDGKKLQKMLIKISCGGNFSCIVLMNTQ